MLVCGLIVAAVFALTPILCAPAIADDLYCNLVAPPANAVADADHGYYFFMFPDALPVKFTGCKTLWIDTGRKYLVFHMKEGRVTEVTMLRNQAEQSADKAEYASCLYPEEALAKDSPDDCLDFENAQSFADHEMGTKYGPNVPAAKDIRTKTPL